ncbi:hypothetical protein H5410_031373 [Solanum commersonii]|uniref:RNase H type-1 domain-containing protein n=1 Tax=Solanum commersonii TaxID=4109 RepID=A0A9J5YGY7_SOLCO|nr:hypothetical protein H5410_031373 [Solanum commersonii]
MWKIVKQEQDKSGKVIHSKQYPKIGGNAIQMEIQGKIQDLVIIETDSLALVHILNGEWEVPWRVIMEANSINRLRNALTVTLNTTNFGNKF